jgi:mannose-6-phosphate isomerase-like protein (cupin superfamily)
MKIRRVVTGHGVNGKSRVASDEMVEPVTVALAPGMEFHRLWGSDSAPAYPDDGSPLSGHAYFPPADGFRFISFMVPAATSAEPAAVPDVGAAVAEAENKLPGLLGHMEPENPGFHTTQTVDMLFVVSGAIVMRLDEGEVELRAGDVYVQSGTRHAWVNRGSEPAVLVGVIVGARKK